MLNNWSANPNLNTCFCLPSSVDNISPLDQFEIRDLLRLDITIFNVHVALTNIGFYLICGALIVITLNILATNYNKLISNR
jgi:hypothetical protein